MKTKTQVKEEQQETVGDVLTYHSPKCELRVQIANIMSLNPGEESPSTTLEYSTDSTVMGGITTPQAHLLETTIGSCDNYDLNTQITESETNWDTTNSGCAHTKGYSADYSHNTTTNQSACSKDTTVPLASTSQDTTKLCTTPVSL